MAGPTKVESSANPVKAARPSPGFSAAGLAACDRLMESELEAGVSVVRLLNADDESRGGLGLRSGATRAVLGAMFIVVP